ncbi:hypothetical protein FH972_025829 [Carpinus fangiana]|uniref:Glycosyltransferase family 71 protein n=1 Tax=Carpinus fangiana TaxID=176857 RepID=A0A5N6L288_9ROSI|nr:hypothetical protein FH972_025829 [Carpinus fangiana]
MRCPISEAKRESQRTGRTPHTFKWLLSADRATSSAALDRPPIVSLHLAPSTFPFQLCLKYGSNLGAMLRLSAHPLLRGTGRKSRLIIGGILCAIAIVALLRHNDAGSQPGRHENEALSQVFGGLSSTIPLQTHPEDVVTKNAHRFASPDDFLGDHLDRIRRLTPLSVAETKQTCKWTANELETTQFMWGPTSEWMKQDFDLNETEFRRHEWMNHLEKETIPWSTVRKHFKGRGIVTAAGHINSLKRLAVALRQLTRLGSTLPMEVAYWKDEISDDQKAWLEGLYPHMYWNDLSSPKNVFKTHSPKEKEYGHYHLKTAAVLNSRFAEILLLDSDNLPMVKPESLFETPTYQEYGTIFWPDMARTRAENPMWAITRTRCRMDEYEQESGQLLVDKRKFWYHLQMSAWMNEQPYYLSMLLGDKDMFRFAWHGLKTEFGRPTMWLTSIGLVYDGRYCGHTYAQRHPDNSVAFLHRGLYKLHHKASLKWFRERGGMFTHYKQSPYDMDMNHPVPTKWNFDILDDIKGGQAWSCMDLVGVAHKPVEELIPGGVEKLWEALDGYWIINDPDEE